MEPFLPDAELLARSIDEPQYFSKLYDRHLATVTRYVVRRVGNEPGEDLAAEVFVRAFRGRAGYAPQHETALPWLLGVASHLIADHRRAERRRLAALERLARSSPQAVEHEHAGLAPALVVELRRLPRADRDALLLIVWGELSYEEAATALGVPIGTVRSRIARARHRLSEAIGERGRPQLTGELAMRSESNV